MSTITVKAGGAEATIEVEKKKTAVSALLGAATAVGPGAPSREQTTAASATSSANAVVASALRLNRIVSEETLPKFVGRHVLWVDDRPEGNGFLIQAFRELDIDVEIARSTDAALRILEDRRIDVIITDMGRPGDARAGYTLLRGLSDRKIATPVIVYAGSDLEEYRREAIAAGAIESTNKPQRVFDLVTGILANNRYRRTGQIKSMRFVS